MGGRPRGSDARACLRALEHEFNWTYTEAAPRAHPAGFLTCTADERPCKIIVYGTANNSARAIWKHALKCTHGCSPDRRQW